MLYYGINKDIYNKFAEDDDLWIRRDQADILNSQISGMGYHSLVSCFPS